MKALYECEDCQVQVEWDTDSLDSTVRCPVCGIEMNPYYEGYPLDEIEPISVGSKGTTGGKEDK